MISHEPLRTSNQMFPANADLSRILDSYLAALRRGERPDKTQVLRDHPQLAGELSGCLLTLDLLQGCADFDLELSEDHGAQAAARTLGDYRLFREVGRGGMGVVYEAEQISLARRVALKILPFAAVLDPRHLQRFKNEAMAAAHLDHPNIVEVYGIGCERSIHFYAMRFIEGVTLAEVVEAKKRSQEPGARRQEAKSEVGIRKSEVGNADVEATSPLSLPSSEFRIPNYPDTSPVLQAALSTVNGISPKERFRRIAEIGIQAAEALDHAHQMGIVHRDIKPSNLMLDERGKPWVTDFGLARSTSEASMTMTGDLVGTLRYMSPEQALAKRITVDHRTDIYSLGVTLYELLTLHAAFPGNDREETLRQIALEEPTAPRKLDRSIPAELETIVLKAMEKNPDDRYASAKELADDLRRWVEHKPIVARRPGVVVKARKWARRHRGVMVAICVVATVITAGSLTAAVMLYREQQRTQEAKVTSQEVVGFLVNKLLMAPARAADVNHEITVAEVLDSTEREMDKSLADQPRVMAAVDTAMAQTYTHLQKLDQAERHARRAVDLGSQYNGRDHEGTLVALDTLTQVLMAQGKVAEARKLSEDALQSTRRTYGPNHPQTLQAIKSLSGKYVYAEALSPEELKVAIPLCREALELSRRLNGADSLDSLGEQYGLAYLTSLGGNLKRSLQLFQELHADCDRLRDAEHGSAKQGLAKGDAVYQASERRDFALEVLALHCRRHEIDLQFELGEVAEAVSRTEEAMPEYKRLLGEASPIVLQIMFRLSRYRRALGTYDEASHAAKEGYDISRKRNGAGDELTRLLAHELSASLPNQDRDDECREIIRELLDDLPADDFETLNNIALCLATSNSEALRDGRRAVELATKACEGTHFKSANYLSTLADAQAECGDFADAIETMTKALELANTDELRKRYAKDLELLRAGTPLRSLNPPPAT